MSVQERQALEGSRLPFFDPDPITYDWDRPIRDISLRYKLSYPLATVLIHAYFRSFTSYGVDNIPETGGFILAANHVSTYDPISVYYGMRGKRSMYIMAKEEFFTPFIPAGSSTTTTHSPSIGTIRTRSPSVFPDASSTRDRSSPCSRRGPGI